MAALGNQRSHGMGFPQLLPLELSDRAVRTLAPDLECAIGYVTGSDIASSFSSKPESLGNRESIVSHDIASPIANPTEATPVDEDDDDNNGAPLVVDLPSCINQDQDREHSPEQVEDSNGKEVALCIACIDDEGFGDGGLADAASGVIQISTFKDPLTKVGPGRCDYTGKVTASADTRGSVTGEHGDVHSIEGSSLLNSAWKHRDENTNEVQNVTRSVQRTNVLPRLAMSHDSSRMFTPVVDSSMSAKQLCATKHKDWPAEAHRKTVPRPSTFNTARQTQVHGSEFMFHRLMPPDRVIYFDVDRDSFKCAGIPDEVTDRVITAAKKVVTDIKGQNLGISFAYRPNSASNVFAIRYKPNVDPEAPEALAQAFFPSDSRRFWELTISKSLIYSVSGIDYLEYLPNILSHEFAHILGLRHWNAGTYESERSFQWPNTVWESKESVMITHVHPEMMRFSTEDYRVIREIYSLVNGDMFSGRRVIDVLP